MSKRVQALPEAKVAAAVADPTTEVVQVPVVVTGTTAGPPSPLQKLQGYYKGLIALVGFLVILINELTPLLDFLPGQDKQYVTVAVGVLTTLGVLLKANEHWFDSVV